ncbi:MAG TPA: carbamate kinase [Clostridiales bacterium]|mgnify:CR=1 FL=1|nr:carbamate kinase [Clostridiales bacterium]HQP70409.1 carbamate kinase [Clostridiales bacterium]
MYNKRVVIAIGGNSLTPTDNSNWIGSQFKNTRTSIESLIPLVEKGYSVTITHGNGPQVGVALRRVEETRDKLPDIPLGVLVADTEGSMGYMIEQSLQNKLFDKGLKIPVATILTQVLVDQNDPALTNPTKYIGSFYTEEEAKKLAAVNGWIVKQDADRGWRRVVGSPKPIDIVNKNIIKQLLDQKNIVIAAGGGGIPVYLDEKKHFEGVDAVIDKDMASALLANEIGADELFIMTAVSKVSLNFKKPDQVDLDVMTLSEADKYLNEGHFPYGSMGPKMKSAIMFLRNGGKRVIITAIDNLMDAIEGKDGTSIVQD